MYMDVFQSRKMFFFKQFLIFLNFLENYVYLKIVILKNFLPYFI